MFFWKRVIQRARGWIDMMDPEDQSHYSRQTVTIEIPVEQAQLVRQYLRGVVSDREHIMLPAHVRQLQGVVKRIEMELQRLAPWCERSRSGCVHNSQGVCLYCGCSDLDVN